MIMMQGTYYKEWSSVLNREMEFKVYGSAGVPVLALPARGGRFYDWENNGMPDAIAQLLNEGKGVHREVESEESRMWGTY